jgi:hypothetical protein
MGKILYDAYLVGHPHIVFGTSLFGFVSVELFRIVLQLMLMLESMRDSLEAIL